MNSKPTLVLPLVPLPFLLFFLAVPGCADKESDRNDARGGTPQACDCDITPACDDSCACDDDCEEGCLCDTSNMCDAGCSCDEDCTSGCDCDTSDTCQDNCDCDEDCQSSVLPGPYESCEATRACQPGSDCMPIVQGVPPVCLPTCQLGADTCGENATCEVPTAGDTDGWCLQQAARDEECLSNGAVCLEGLCQYAGTVDFDPTAQDLTLATGLRCKISCTYEERLSQGSCPDGELCLEDVASPIFEPQLNEEVQVTCEDDAGCDGANGYSCFELVGGELVCGRMPSSCQTVSPFLGVFSQAAIRSYVDNGYYCDTLDDHKGCAVVGATGAPAGTMCYPLVEPPPFGDWARNRVGFCIGFCTAEDGSDLDCGAGYTCADVDWLDPGYKGCVPL